MVHDTPIYGGSPLTLLAQPGPLYLEVVMRRYGFGNFLFDLIMICITGGLWLIWIFIREMRKQY